MHNGSLRKQLDDTGPSSLQSNLNWSQRLQIAKNAARGIEYIHCGHAAVVVHGDSKRDNILLDDSMRARFQAGTDDGSQMIVEWADSHIGTGDIQAIMDPSLGEDCDVKSVERIAALAKKCVKPQLVERPPISTILEEIQRAISVEINKGKGIH
ncbi:serine/threonine-protein kinase-like protein CR4 [Prosopis cineraria]|uniref:serine/threonine-protein kinase-like protein CR4 n=1 Tax=Prosopis cineraria TaxID=364024 RepID=UPI0024105008|nr:serine/threonine-protein kinase-like protein CR4 [Prosopis cineraria]